MNALDTERLDWLTANPAAMIIEEAGDWFFDDQPYPDLRSAIDAARSVKPIPVSAQADALRAQAAGAVPVAMAKDGQLFWRGNPQDHRGENFDLYAGAPPAHVPADVEAEAAAILAEDPEIWQVLADPTPEPAQAVDAAVEALNGLEAVAADERLCREAYDSHFHKVKANLSFDQWRIAFKVGMRAALAARQPNELARKHAVYLTRESARDLLKRALATKEQRS